MTFEVQKLKSFLAGNGRAALVEVAGTKGSAPRDKGTFMLVSPSAIFGTIGGGQLEYMAIDKAREMLRSVSSAGVSHTAAAAPPGRFAATLPSRGRDTRATLDVPLGPEIGQCCGGRVDVSIRLADASIADELIALAQMEEERLPHLYVFGGGHVGKALVAAAALLPVRVVAVETRAEELAGMPETVETKLTAMPEDMVRKAPAGSGFVILTHDHALDFLIVAEALKRGDAAYVGMIGSKTKKATFRNWFLKNAGGSETEFLRLVSPIGGDKVKDKRPTVIAALASAEIMTALAVHATLLSQSEKSQAMAG